MAAMPNCIYILLVAVGAHESNYYFERLLVTTQNLWSPMPRLFAQHEAARIASDDSNPFKNDQSTWRINLSPFFSFGTVRDLLQRGRPS
ncbi:hypothetical protein BDN70DRAFT_246189 [Pholiota conissans]|uniref:Uncharacterized protein n=1 Tax=Pholiota conissans TaxID=109636 RepID=A0A9P6CYB0_9AGAR|nr:hypothetical protein BDN70DRAFT_246189 [Pholiota conissans]